jgi:hypothetical protein
MSNHTRPDMPAVPASLATRLLNLGRQTSRGPLADLIRRLDRPDGRVWLSGAMADWPFTQIGGDAESTLLRGQASLDQLATLKRTAKSQASDPGDADRLIRAVLGYYLSVATALVHHQKNLSSQPPNDLADAFGELGAALGAPWDDLAGRAALTLLSPRQTR